MAILKIRDSNGNIQEILAIKGKDGKDYVLTDADKREIAGMVSSDGDMSIYALKENVPAFEAVTDEEINNFDFTDETTKTILSYLNTTGEPFINGVVFLLGNDVQGLTAQLAIGEDGLVYVRNEFDNFAEWHCVNDERYTRKIDFENLVEDLKLYQQSYSEIHNDFNERIEKMEKVDTSKFVTEADVIRLISENYPDNGDGESY